MKDSLNRRSDGQGSKPERNKNAADPAKRAWRVSLARAAILVAAAVAFSAIVNPLLGRSVHWDWMAGVAFTLFVVATVALRLRWVR